ncbi:MAG: glycosyltransferase family 39 protein [Azonexus sp.]|nr:glycosyltransferase family 39 protein [Azonexus sp.]
MSDALFLGLLALWLGFLSWLRPLSLPDEGRYPGVAWEMLRSSEWATPLLNGLPYFHKPPLFYWLDMLSIQLFGMNEWTARLPSLLAAWLALAGLHVFVGAYFDRRTACVTTLMLATTPLFFGAAQYADMNMLVAAMIALCLLAAADTVLRRADGRPYRAMSLAAAAFAALAVLAKGLIGIALPGLILLLWLMARRDGRGFLALVWPPALAVFASIVLPWFVLMQMRYPGFFHYFFVYQHFERFSGGGFNNVMPFWFFALVLLVGCLPWSLWGWRLAGRAFWRAEDPRKLRLLMGWWAAVVLVFFSLPSSKLVGYILPALIPLVFLLAQALLQRVGGDGFSWSAKHNRWAVIGLASAAVICLIVALVAAFAPQRSNKALALGLRDQLVKGDTLVALSGYPFDLPFYARYSEPLWVVDDWENRQAILREDSWRKELYDAGEFDPTAARETLLTPSALSQRLCAAPSGTRFWFWKALRDKEQTPPRWLDGLPPIFSDGHGGIWRIEVSAAFKERLCRAAPDAAIH